MATRFAVAAGTCSAGATDKPNHELTAARTPGIIHPTMTDIKSITITISHHFRAGEVD
jgi:hypothetical protein